MCCYERLRIWTKILLTSFFRSKTTSERPNLPTWMVWPRRLETFNEPRIRTGRGPSFQLRPWGSWRGLLRCPSLPERLVLRVVVAAPLPGLPLPAKSLKWRRWWQKRWKWFEGSKSIFDGDFLGLLFRKNWNLVSRTNSIFERLITFSLVSIP